MSPRSPTGGTNTTAGAASGGKATRTRRHSLVNSIMNKSPKVVSQSIVAPSNATTVTVEPDVASTRRTARRNSLLCSNKISKSPTAATSPSTPPSIEKVATSSTAGTATRRHSSMSSTKSKIPTVAARSASVATPLSKRHGMTLRSTAKKQPQVEQAVTGAKKLSTPKSFESKVRKTISFLTPPSDSKKSGSSAPTDAGSKKVYKKTPLPSKKKKALDNQGEQKGGAPAPIVKDPTTFQGVRFDVPTPSQKKKTGSKTTAGSNKVYKKTPKPSRKKKPVDNHDDKIACLPERVLSDPIQEIKDNHYLDSVKVQFDSETASNNTSSDSLIHATVAVVMEADDIMEAASMTQPAMDEKDTAWAKLPVEGEEEEEELSLIEAAIALFPLLTRSEDERDSANDEDAEHFLDTVMNSEKIATLPKLKKKTTAEQETMNNEEMMNDVLVANGATDLETIVSLSEMTDEKNGLGTDDDEMMSWKHVISALLGAMVLTSSLALTTQHLNGVCLLA
jgi:hypothetical protein